jgi:hypothetical protein
LSAAKKRRASARFCAPSKWWKKWLQMTASYVAAGSGASKALPPSQVTRSATPRFLGDAPRVRQDVLPIERRQPRLRQALQGGEAIHA